MGKEVELFLLVTFVNGIHYHLICFYFVQKAFQLPLEVQRNDNPFIKLLYAVMPHESHTFSLLMIAWCFTNLLWRNVMSSNVFSPYMNQSQASS